jgi:hypothetical protein
MIINKSAMGNGGTAIIATDGAGIRPGERAIFNSTGIGGRILKVQPFPGGHSWAVWFKFDAVILETDGLQVAKDLKLKVAIENEDGRWQYGQGLSLLHRNIAQHIEGIGPQETGLRPEKNLKCPKLRKKD